VKAVIGTLVDVTFMRHVCLRKGRIERRPSPSKGF
jgi:hypothetical protein